MTAVPLDPIPAASPDAASPRDPARRILRGANPGDGMYKGTLTALALSLPLFLITLVTQLLVSAWPSIHRFGFHFLWSSVWDPVAGVFGAAPMIFGTLVSSLLALVLAVPLALGVAIYLTEFAPK